MSVRIGLLAAWSALATWGAQLAIAAPSGSSTEHWVSTWATAQQLAPPVAPKFNPLPPADKVQPPPKSPIPAFPAALDNQTVRMIVRTSIGGRQVRVELSNELGGEPLVIQAAHIALHEKDSGIVTATDRALTFAGKSSVTVMPGAITVSDPADLAVAPLAELSVSVYLPNKTGPVTTHALGLHDTYIAVGDATGRAALAGPDVNRSYFWLTGVEVLAPAKAAAIVALGDSITDGFMTTPNAYRAWPDILAVKLHADRRLAHCSVLNLGISGNRVLRDGAGASALARFDRDVLSRLGVRWIVLLEGINDINISAVPHVPESERTTAAQIIEGYQQIIERAHLHNIRVVGATIMPTEGLWLYGPDTEAMRQAVNLWIRTSGRFDAVADFDAATRDPSRPARLRADFDSGDHIHPNDAGNAAMANAVDLAVVSK